MFVFWFIFHWSHGDLTKWKYFLRYWPCVRGIHRWLVVTHKGQRRGDLMFSFMCIWRKGWAKHQNGDHLRRHRAHDVAVTLSLPPTGYKSVLIHVIVWCRIGDKPIYWCNNDPVYWRLYVSPGRNELILLTSYAYIFTETSQLITTSKQHVSDISQSLLKIFTQNTCFLQEK